MCAVQSSFVKETVTKKTLTLSLDEGDDVIKCILQGMTENGLTEVKVSEANGFLSHATINCMQGHKYKKMDLKDVEILRVSGQFKLGGGDLWGSMNIFTAGHNPFSGTLVKGIAKQGFELRLTFYPTVR